MNRETGSAIIQGEILDDQVRYSFRQMCRACGVHGEIVVDMVEHGVIRPQGGPPGNWRFSGHSVTRAQRALRLSRDLGVNWAGAALALDLLEE